MTVKIITLGCKVNQYDSSELAAELTSRGYLITAGETADICIINSCTVTAESTRKTRQAVRRERRENPDAIIVLTGCMPQAFPSDAVQLGEADIIIGNKSKSAVCRAIEEFSCSRSKIVRIEKHERDEEYSGGGIRDFQDHTRAFIKIQDGCDRFCSYCAIPYARGRSRSRTLSEIKIELERVAQNGFLEVVLVGINLSSYGKDLGLTIADAVKAAENTEGIKRIRLGSLEPDLLTDEMLDFLKNSEKFCPHFHISLQSGSDSVLKRMNRHYTTQEYRTLVKRIRDRFDDPAITTDIITGFPGESEKEFEETLAFAKEIKFDKVHIFPYSAREGTSAARMNGQIEKNLKESRARELAAICENIRHESLTKKIGSVQSVLFEEPQGDMQRGYSKNYLPVFVHSRYNIKNQIFDVEITDLLNDSCEGIIRYGKK